MSTTYFTLLKNSTFILLFSLITAFQGQAVVTVCTICTAGEYGGQMVCGLSMYWLCPDGIGRSTGNQKSLERTFKPKSKHITQRLAADCLNPELEVSIDSTDMSELMAVGNIRLYGEFRDTAGFNMDVGVASEDTQFWQMPILDLSRTQVFESIDPADSPYFLDFDTSNVVFAGVDSTVNDSIYVHYQTNAEEVLKLGLGNNNQGDPYILDWFETKAFLPIECGWEIMETITTEWAFDPEIDSLVEVKNVVTQSTGMFTPINEAPVPAVLLYVDYDYAEWKDGLKIDSSSYRSMVWFTANGHTITGYLAEGAPREGNTTFQAITYDKNIQTCPPDQDLGIDLPPGTYRAQNTIESAASLTQGPIQFIAGQELELKNGFTSTNELSLFVDPDPCNVEF